MKNQKVNLSILAGNSHGGMEGTADFQKVSGYGNVFRSCSLLSKQFE